MELEDDPRSGRPISKATQENIDLVRQLIDEDPHSTYEDIEGETGLSHGTVFTIIHQHLQKQKISSRWVPHELTLEQKKLRVQICRENLKKFEQVTWRLCDILTCDETWIYLRQIGRKQSNACWRDKGQEPGTVVTRERNELKVQFSIFFRSSGAVFVRSLGKGETLDQFYYQDNCLKPVIKELQRLRPETGTRGIKLLHDNARPHSAQEAKDYLKKEGINLMPHPPYSPDLAPCDYWLNSYMKQQLHTYKDANSLHNAVSKVVFNIPTEEYRKTFNKMIERIRLCIKNNGDYFEHLIK